jgi:translocation and assembly module TamB
VPILRQTTPYLNPAGLTKPFEAGDVRADLRNGVFRVQRLALANPGAQVFAEGTIALSGRLDLNVVAHTGAIGPGVRALRLFGLRIPALGPLPLTLIRDVSDFLANRTVRLSVTGTVGNPIVRVNVGALLAEEAVRFFLTRYVLPAEAAGALGVGAGAGVGLGTMDNRR